MCGQTVLRRTHFTGNHQGFWQPRAVEQKDFVSGLWGIVPAKQFPTSFLREAGVYRCEAATVEGFVQQLAVAYVLHGYRYYVRGIIPAHKDPCAVDDRIVERYGIDIPKWTRSRRKRHGAASVQYLRHGRTFLILATEGEHTFFEKETRVQDLRETPVVCFGYRISCYQRSDGRWHSSVRIGTRRFLNLRRWFRQNAVQRSADDLGGILRRLPYAPFAPVRSQYISLLGHVNRARKRAGLPLVCASCVRRRRKPVRVFI